MKVCFVTTAFPRWVGDGDGAFIWELVRAVARRGIHTCVVAAHSPGVPTREYMDGIEVIRPRYWWPERWEVMRIAGGGLPVAWKRYPITRVQVLPFLLAHTLATVRSARSCDLVHAHWTLSAGVACLGRTFHRRPVIATVQGSDILQVPRHPVGAWLTRSILLSCDRVTALSHALKERVVGLGIDPERVHIIPNGVDTAQFVPPDKGVRENLILFVGSLIERKGVSYLLKAMPAVLSDFPDYRLVVVGDGPQADFLKALADKLRLGACVTFVGFQPQEIIRSWMQRAKLLVLPSLEEGMGVVLVEALACGTPIVASHVDGIRDVITPSVGVLVAPADSEALFAAMREILADPDRWKDMSRSARARAVTHYGWDEIAGRFVNLYRSVV
ncbi:MAG: glycosyltransferase [Roseiflexus sp.]